MAKAPNSVVGVDIGRYALKSVLLQRRGGRIAVTHYGSHIPGEPVENPEGLSRHLKALFRDLGASAKACVVGVSSPDSLIRIIEQPPTPTNLLRDALRLNGMNLMNQDCRGFVLDCDKIEGEPPPPDATGSPHLKYLVGGLPRAEVQQISEALETASLPVRGLQLSPVCIFNAFEFAQPEVFNEQAFFLVDVGHTLSTMLVGAKRELALVRSIEFGGKGLLEALSGLSGEPREGVIAALDQEDEVMVEYTRVAINTLAREIGSSIGFFEARHEHAIGRVFVSGGPAKSRTFLKLLGEELAIPCESWCALDQCENEIRPDRQDDYEREKTDLNAACGAAIELIKTT
jgi:Tfp pilus assembly PilM family ATPase